MKRRIGLVIGISMLSVILLGISCSPDRDLSGGFSSIVKPYRFSIAKWEFRTLFGGEKQAVSVEKEGTGGEASEVLEYFSSVERIKALRSELEAINAGSRQGDVALLEAELSRLQQQKIALENVVERTLERQVREALSREGIFNPVEKYIRLKIAFPPLNFNLGKPPHLLVVSPRDRIESIREVTLKQSIAVEEMESIEDEVDKLGVSSLVVELGGFSGTYPTFVTDEASLRFTLDTVTEEWLHQYLVFKPLGFLHLLDLTGISRNYEIATMSETLAGMVGKEIGSIVYEKYYQRGDGSQPQAAESAFDFNKEMREIRRAVDEYLAQGEIEPAEEFMEEKRQYLASEGYHIRKLNQAYFAFHGTYADKPTSISPIGVEMRELRSQSASLKEFLDAAAAMTSRQDLIDSLE